MPRPQRWAGHLSAAGVVAEVKYKVEEQVEGQTAGRLEGASAC